MPQLDSMDKLVSLTKRRGYVFQSSEIYGGTGSVWDYGPLGIELKRNVQEAWWSAMVHQRDDVEGVDAAILMHPRVWEASGHVDGFTDPLVECKTCKKRYRADAMEGVRCGRKPSKAPGEFKACELGEPRLFNLMFKTFMGPVEEAAATVYLRPETAQGSYVNFLNVQTTARQKVPFGVAQIGKAFRNEITPGNFIFRTREFEQAEMQFFVTPGTDEEWFEHWREARMRFHQETLGIRGDSLRFSEHGPGELAHYAKRAVDIEYEFPFGWKELEGIHNRTDFDLARHQQYSGKKMRYVEPGGGGRYIPYVIETAAGIDRMLLMVLSDAYYEEQVGRQRRTVLGIHPRLAPVKAAIFPLVRKDGLPEIATRLHDAFKAAAVPSFYDAAGSIGRRYRRQDEAGTPWCITVDGQTGQDGTVTVRDRDTLEQVRVNMDGVIDYLRERLAR